MWTKKGVATLGGAILALLLAVFLSNHLLLVVGIALLSMVVFSTISGAHVKKPKPVFFPEENVKEETDIVKVRRSLSTRRIFEEATIEVKVELAFQKPVRGFVEIFDSLPNEVELVKGDNRVVMKGGGEKRFLITYQVRCPLMGPYSIGPVKVRWEDPLGLTYVEEEVHHIDDILVMPRVEDISEVFIRSKVPKMYSGAMTVRKPGPGYDFFALRQYVHGDPIRDVNWKASARTGKLMINEHEREAISHVMLILDATSTTDAGQRDSTALVRGARAVASLASYFINRRDSVGLVVYDSSLRMISPATGQGQLMKILEALAILEPKGDMPMEIVSKVGLTYLPSRSPVIIVSPVSQDESTDQAVAYMLAHGFNVTLLSLSAAEMEYENGVLDRSAITVERFYREGMGKRLSAMGATFVDWHPDETVSMSLMGV